MPVAKPTLFKLAILLTETVPIKIMDKFANVVGDKKMQEKVAMMKMLSERMFNMQSIFFHFLNNTWNFLQRNTEKVWKLMSAQEREIFNLDVVGFSWEKAMEH